MTNDSSIGDDCPSDQGFALLLVVWVLALLALLSATVATDSRSEAVIARNRLLRAEARELADAGVALAVAGLIDPDPSTRWRADNQPQTIQYGGGKITIAIQDEGGKIDLNNAPIELIAGLLDELGIASDDRAAITAGILERRHQFASANATPEQSVMTGNTLMNRMELLTAGLPVPSPFAATKNSPAADLGKQAFANLSELRLIPQMKSVIFDQLRPYMTVFSGISTINPLTATPEALLAIPGISQQEVEFWISSRDRATATVEKPSLSGADRYAQVAEVRAATVTTTALTSAGASFNREATISISPLLPLQPFRILKWRETENAAGGDTASR